MQLYQNATSGTENQDIIAEAAVVFELLAAAMTIIAQPNTPAVLRQALAILGYNCATNWASMLTADFSVVEGGAQ